MLLQVCCILHNMLLQYDGLDTIGDEDGDYKDEEDEEGPMTEQDSDTNIAAPIGARDVVVEEEEAEVQVGYAEKRSRLWVHHKYSIENGLIRWMKKAEECRMNYRTGPQGCDGPWRMN